jgi:hypothetical protein
MSKEGFQLKHEWRPNIGSQKGIHRRDTYFAKFHEYPQDFLERSLRDKEDPLMRTRIALRAIAEKDGSMYAFSFYPDMPTIKEVGDPFRI